MRRLLPIALAALLGITVLGQDVTGIWQGTFKLRDRELRTVFEISPANGGGLNVVAYSIDEGGRPISGSAALEGSTLKMSVPSIGGKYEGKLSPDGLNLTGTWSQGTKPSLSESGACQ